MLLDKFERLKSDLVARVRTVSSGATEFSARKSGGDVAHFGLGLGGASLH